MFAFACENAGDVYNKTGEQTGPHEVTSRFDPLTLPSIYKSKHNHLIA